MAAGALGLGALALACLMPAFFPAPLPGVQPIMVTASPLDFDPREPGRVRFGKLRWIGGLVLRSSHPAFGGYSGLSLDDSGTRLLAVSDRGTWLSAGLISEDGRPAGLSGARIGPLLDEEGRPLRGRTLRDAEGLAALTPGAGDGAYLISFERAHRILRYRFTGEAFRAEKTLALPEAIRNLPANDGLEGLTALRAGEDRGAILTFAESASGRSGVVRGWLIKEGRTDEVSLRDRDGFSVTDLAALANGDVLALQRRYRGPLDGVRMRLLRLSADGVRRGAQSGALIEPEVLIEADARMGVDNMEGLAVIERPGGGVLVTMISDDNFSPLQRTLLLQFALEAEDGGGEERGGDATGAGSGGGPHRPGL